MLYTHNVHKEVRKAIDDAERAGLSIVRACGHTWGYIACSCGQRIPVYSTGKAPEYGAKLIRRFIDKHGKHQQL